MEVDNLVRNFSNYRSECINLIPSENILSPKAQKALISDYGSRYYFDDPFSTGKDISYHYFGTKGVNNLIKKTNELSCKLFNSAYSNVYPLSGHLANLSVLLAFCKHKDRIMCISPDNGGYPGLSYDKLPRYINLETDYFPFNGDVIDYGKLGIMLSTNFYRIMFLSSAHTLFSEDIYKIRDQIEKYSPETILVFDASHPLGLIAGGRYSNPLLEGADILLGSTQKSFPGPQGGIILTNNSKLHKLIDYSTHFVTLDNPHFHRIAALAITLEEMIEFGKKYANQIVSNARELASALEDKGIKILNKSAKYTDSHQIKIQDISFHKKLAPLLEKCNIIVDNAGRLGVNEMTRYGMKEREMHEIALFFFRCC